MQTPAIITILKMIETLPESAQNQIADHLREYIAEMQDEAVWDELFANTQEKLMEAAQRAKAEIAAGKSIPMDYDAL